MIFAILTESAHHPHPQRKRGGDGVLCEESSPSAHNPTSAALERSGKILVKVDRFFPSSKTCSNCYHRVSSLPLDVRHWTCSSCGTHHDRDVNAAQNLKAEGLRLLALGTSATAGGGDVRPSRGRKTAMRQSPAKPEATRSA
ncbi:zinc ribbon domain-containing protein [Chamaesiphon sp. OTE_20_metabat_361]|uniref:zinc ribbon domain-containing protein n=1 Tax=Chamaesiphon sp. OTE_20_metabat_361 TaxID=2964689 RepID=UPI00286B74E5|nr:zinc ribbon domain-containing protein [Chamaesiphon sp. OTE_20_metabat_361]